MSNISRKVSLLFVVFCLSAGQLFAAGLEEYSKTVNKEFTVEKNTSVGISNKFGKVHVTTWNENRVVIEVFVKVDAKSPEKGQKMLDQIEISFDASADEIIAKTEFSLKGNNNVLEVNYTVKMPANNPLSIKNKFGDVFLNETNGKFKLGLSYGNVTIGKLNHADSKINMDFSKGSISTMSTAEIDLSYSELKVESAESIKLDSDFSDFKIGTVKSIKFDSQYDDYEIGQADAISADCQFTTVEVDQLTTDLKADVQYGGLTVKNISKSFKQIKVDSQFGDVVLNFENGTGYNLQAEVSMGDLDYPKSDGVKVTEKSLTSNSYAGNVGNGSGAVVVDVQYGNVTLKD